MERSGQLRSQVGQVAPLTGEIAVPRCTVLLPPLAAGGVDLRTREQEVKGLGTEMVCETERRAASRGHDRTLLLPKESRMDGRDRPGWLGPGLTRSVLRVYQRPLQRGHGLSLVARRRPSLCSALLSSSDQCPALEELPARPIHHHSCVPATHHPPPCHTHTPVPSVLCADHADLERKRGASGDKIIAQPILYARRNIP